MAKNDTVTNEIPLDVPRETMELNAIERKKIADALDIYAGVLKRKVAAEKNEAIKAIYTEDARNIIMLCGRFS